MKNLKWFWVALFVSGGLFIVAIAYLLLRSSGVIYKLMPDNDNKWVEYEG